MSSQELNYKEQLSILTELITKLKEQSFIMGGWATPSYQLADENIISKTELKNQEWFKLILEIYNFDTTYGQMTTLIKKLSKMSNKTVITAQEFNDVQKDLTKLITSFTPLIDALNSPQDIHRLKNGRVSRTFDAFSVAFGNIKKFSPRGVATMHSINQEQPAPPMFTPSRSNVASPTSQSAAIPRIQAGEQNLNWYNIYEVIDRLKVANSAYAASKPKEFTMINALNTSLDLYNQQTNASTEQSKLKDIVKELNLFIDTRLEDKRFKNDALYVKRLNEARKTLRNLSHTETQRFDANSLTFQKAFKEIEKFHTNEENFGFISTFLPNDMLTWNAKVDLENKTSIETNQYLSELHAKFDKQIKWLKLQPEYTNEDGYRNKRNLIALQELKDLLPTGLDEKAEKLNNIMLALQEANDEYLKKFGKTQVVDKNDKKIKSGVLRADTSAKYSHANERAIELQSMIEKLNHRDPEGKLDADVDKINTEFKAFLDKYQKYETKDREVGGWIKKGDVGTMLDKAEKEYQSNFSEQKKSRFRH